MNEDSLRQFRSVAEGLSPQELLAHARQAFGDRVALASSFSPEDQVLTDMLAGLSPRIGIFTLDTGRLPQETYDLLDRTARRYGIEIQVLFPDRSDIEDLIARTGVNSFYDSIENRKACCHARKVVPLRRKLSQLDAWVTGLRREQSVTRSDVGRVEWDAAQGLVKLNPLADWTNEQVWDYVRAHDVPVSVLHDRGYPSIGCAPCTRAVEPGQDARAGRWWWEQPEHKECGLHVPGSGAVRRRPKP